MKRLNYVLVILLSFFIQNVYSQSPLKKGDKKHQLDVSDYKVGYKDGSNSALIQQKRTGNVIFASKSDYDGKLKVLASGSHTPGSLGFAPKSILVSKSGRYVVIELLRGIDPSSFVVRDDIPNLAQYINNLMKPDSMVVVPPASSASQQIAKIIIMQY